MLKIKTKKKVFRGKKFREILDISGGMLKEELPYEYLNITSTYVTGGNEVEGKDLVLNDGPANPYIYMTVDTSYEEEDFQKNDGDYKEGG